MTTISATGNQSVNTLLAATKTTATVTAVASQQASATQSTSVTIGQATSSTPVYAITKPALVWENASADLISSRLAGNFNSAGNAARFAGLGAAVLERFTTEAGSYSQSVLKQTAGPASSVSSAQSQLHTKADNQITLSVKTASGALVDITLGSDDDGLGVQVSVTKGTLSKADRTALAGLADGFQKAIDGLTAQPPKLDLSGLTQFDTSVLSSVDLHATLGTNNAQTLDFHADASTRSVKSTGALGTVNISVDMSKRALLGTESQQKQALNQYLKQFSSAGSRGNADSSLLDMFKDAFTALNSNYGASATTYKSSGPEPVHFSLTKTDKNMMTGLADFTASVTQTPTDKTNPMRPDEVDTFSYQVSQASTITGDSTQNRNITQKQQSHLVASFHKSLTPGLQLNLTSDRDSQNYLYYQIDDKAESTTSVQYHKGALVSASVDQSASTSTHIQKYVKGWLESDTTTPVETSKTTDLLGKLQSAWQNDAPRISFRDYLAHQSLPDLSGLVLLESDPAQLKNTLA
ncbi:hypothetical protein CWS43_00290 [Rahnella sp. AA]|uniref:hypothetical protein n=1 Tax=Rahnella sp. AA TaxID=2057180 RepID=UPI000C34B91C|nr:hypothetical protein [Rahnella sp. AA]PKE32383.1 hypothetical protein CWS43_00290 [Rahnella sp. AA]